MPIFFGDKIKILCYKANMYEEEAFLNAIQNARKEVGKLGTSTTLSSNIRDWRKRLYEGASPTEDHKNLLLTALENSWPRHGIARLADLYESSYSVPEFIDKCHVNFREVEHLISEETKTEYEHRHYKLHFLQALTSFENKIVGKKTLDEMVGTYLIYRRHSILPGILREHFIIDKRNDGHCEGTYYQFNRTKIFNKIDFNVFTGGFYIIAIGSHKDDSGRTEVITVQALIENARTLSGDTTSVVDNNFIGLLNGIYDYGQILLSTRVLIRKVSNSIESMYDARKVTPFHLRRDSVVENDKFEYEKIVDIVDNTLDGQTLTARLDRLELLI